MADNKIINNAGATLTTGVSAVASIANGAGSLGSEIVGADLDMQLELTFTAHATPVVNSPIHVYALQAIDGTNYEDGGTSSQPVKLPLWTFLTPADTSAHKQCSAAVRMPRGKFKLLVWNACGQQVDTLTLLATADNRKITAA